MIWKNLIRSSDNNDKAALLRHYAKFHYNILQEKPNLSDCFHVTFIEESEMQRLDWFEGKWFHKLRAKININKLLLPKFK